LPYAMWPVASDLQQQRGLPAVWCEGCFIRPHIETNMPAHHHRYSKKRPVTLEDAVSLSDHIDFLGSGFFCNKCLTLRKFLTPSLLRQWRAWQLDRSPQSFVSLEAFGRCFAQVAINAAAYRERCSITPYQAFQEALHPLSQLAAPPPGAAVELHGTSCAEIATELHKASGFMGSLTLMLGSKELAENLVSEACVESIAGRLLLNTTTLEVPGPNRDDVPLRAVGLFVWLSLMNHACEPTVEPVFNTCGELNFRTRRAVSAGEALTITYVPLSMPFEARRAKLKHWYFDCECSRCEMEALVLEALKSSLI